MLSPSIAPKPPSVSPLNTSDRVWEAFDGEGICLARAGTQHDLFKKISEIFRGKEKPTKLQIKVTPPLSKEVIEIS